MTRTTNPHPTSQIQPTNLSNLNHPHSLCLTVPPSHRFVTVILNIIRKFYRIFPVIPFTRKTESKNKKKTPPVPLAVSTSDSVYHDFCRLLFFHAHRDPSLCLWLRKWIRKWLLTKFLRHLAWHGGYLFFFDKIFYLHIIFIFYLHICFYILSSEPVQTRTRPLLKPAFFFSDTLRVCITSTSTNPPSHPFPRTLPSMPAQRTTWNLWLVSIPWRRPLG